MDRARRIAVPGVMRPTSAARRSGSQRVDQESDRCRLWPELRPPNQVRSVCEPDVEPELLLTD